MAKNPPKQKEGEISEDAAPAPAKKGKKLVLLLVVLVLLGAAGGGATWFFAFRGKTGSAPQEQAKPHPQKPPVFVPLDAFTVNLQPEGGDQYLQVMATLKVLDAPTGDSVKAYMPEIRHRILLLLSSKKASEIGSVDGRERLSDEIRRETNVVLWAAAGVTPKPVAADAPPKAISDAPAPQAKPADAGEGANAASTQEGTRSEERRVGKECRSRWSPYH